MTHNDLTILLDTLAKIRAEAEAARPAYAKNLNRAAEALEEAAARVDIDIVRREAEAEERSAAE